MATLLLPQEAGPSSGSLSPRIVVLTCLALVAALTAIQIHADHEEGACVSAMGRVGPTAHACVCVTVLASLHVVGCACTALFRGLDVDGDGQWARKEVKQVGS